MKFRINFITGSVLPQEHYIRLKIIRGHLRVLPITML